MGTIADRYSAAELALSPLQALPLATDANDISGNGNNGTPVNGPAFGQPGPAADDSVLSLLFNGSNQHVTTSLSTVIGANGFSSSIWIKMVALQNYNAGVTKSDGNYPSPSDFYIDVTGAANAYFGAGPRANLQSINFGGWISNVWYHIVEVCDLENEQIILYQNGTAVASQELNVAVVDNSSVVQIGTRADGVTNLNGYICRELIFNYPLSPSEVSSPLPRDD